MQTDLSRIVFFQSSAAILRIIRAPCAVLPADHLWYQPRCLKRRGRPVFEGGVVTLLFRKAHRYCVRSTGTRLRRCLRSGPGALRQRCRQRRRLQRRHAAWRDGHAHEQGDWTGPDRGDGRDGLVHLHERAGRHLRREGEPAGLQGGRADRRAGHGQHREPRGLAAGTGRPDRDGHGRIRDDRCCRPTRPTRTPS